MEMKLITFNRRSWWFRLLVWPNEDMPETTTLCYVFWTWIVIGTLQKAMAVMLAVVFSSIFLIAYVCDEAGKHNHRVKELSTTTAAFFTRSRAWKVYLMLKGRLCPTVFIPK